MDFALSQKQFALKSVTGDFVNREIMPYAAEWNRAEHVDLAIVGKLAELGIFGMTIPEEYGGIGGDHTSYCIAMEELGRGDSSVRGIVSVSLGLVAKTIDTHGTQEQKQEWLPKLCRGEVLGCFGLTAFLVPADRPGFSVREIKGKLGLRGQATAELILDAVEVPDSWRLGEEGRGFAIAMSTLDKGRMSLAAGCVGIGQGCLDASVEYARQRSQFGRPIAGFQLVQQLIADIAVETAAARLLVWKVADLVDRGLPFATDASIAKLYASEVAVRAANNALQVFGGYGYIDEFPVGKYLRDALVTTVYEGTSQVQRLIIGRNLTGVSAFS